YNQMGQYAKALEFYELELLGDRESGNRGAIGSTLGNIGAIYSSMSEWTKAIEYAEDALKIALDVGQKVNGGIWRDNLAEARVALGEPETGKELAQQALDIARATNSRLLEGNSLLQLGLAADGLGNRAEAVERVKAALAIYGELQAVEKVKALHA